MVRQYCIVPTLTTLSLIGTSEGWWSCIRSKITNNKEMFVTLLTACPWLTITFRRPGFKTKVWIKGRHIRNTCSGFMMMTSSGPDCIKRIHYMGLIKIYINQKSGFEPSLNQMYCMKEISIIQIIFKVRFIWTQNLVPFHIFATPT